MTEDEKNDAVIRLMLGRLSIHRGPGRRRYVSYAGALALAAEIRRLQVEAAELRYERDQALNRARAAERSREAPGA